MSHDEKRFAVILPAAGSGARFQASGGGADKLLMRVGGRSVLARAAALVGAHPLVKRVVIVTGRERFGVYREEVEGALGGAGGGVVVDMVEGGKERWESVLFGLRHLESLGEEAPGYVAVHDAARPLTPAEVVDTALRTAVEQGAALPALAEPATLKRRGADGCVAETVDRRGLFQAQTPQCFHLKTLLAGYEALLKEGRVSDLTDDAQVYERRGLAVPITAGSAVNLKITTPEDVVVAEAILGLRDK